MIPTRIDATGEEIIPRRSIQVIPRQLNLKSGYDPDQLNQLSDELAAEDFIRLTTPPHHVDLTA